MFLWNIAVTSLAEVWIEIEREQGDYLADHVTSLAEVWIEICHIVSTLDNVHPSLPLRKCGLKSRGIEVDIFNLRHFPCGSVD